MWMRFAVHLGSRMPSKPDSLVRARNYVHSVFEDAGLSVREQNYQYYTARHKRACHTSGDSCGDLLLIVRANYDTVQGPPDADQRERARGHAGLAERANKTGGSFANSGDKAP